MSELTKEQLQEIQKHIEEITKEAKAIVKDYNKNPSDLSGSIIQIHEHSPILNENIDNDENK